MSIVRPLTREQSDAWLDRLLVFHAECHARGVHFDYGTCRWRVILATAKTELIEGGVAARVMQAYAGLRLTAIESPDLDLAALCEVMTEGYVLAREIVQHENLPSPGWNTLVEEAGLPADPTGTIND